MLQICGWNLNWERSSSLTCAHYLLWEIVVWLARFHLPRDVSYLLGIGSIISAETPLRDKRVFWRMVVNETFIWNNDELHV